jgi:hypothetical protein
MKISTYLITAGAFASLAGCATTPSELRNAGPDHQSQFVVQQGYQATYRALLERQRACEEIGLVTGAINVQGDLFTDIKSGTITTMGQTAIGNRAMTIIDLKAIDEVSTDVTVFNQEGAWYVARYKASLQRWLTGDHDCVVRA